jgi:hypothetical protein
VRAAIRSMDPMCRRRVAPIDRQPLVGPIAGLLYQRAGFVSASALSCRSRSARLRSRACRCRDPAMRNPYGIAAIFAVLALAGTRGAASAGPQAGEVLGLFGQCFVETGGQRSPLKLGDAVRIGDAVDVGEEAKLKLRMNDGSVIAVAAGSRLTIADYRVGNSGASRDAKLSLGAGLLRAVVSSLQGPAHFEVDTATGVAAVRSTDWFIEAQPGSTQVGVLEGRVSLKSVATGKEIVIPGHWGARVEAGRDPVPARVWTGAEFDNFIRRTNLDAAGP